MKKTKKTKKAKSYVKCGHFWIDADNEGCYGYEECRFCGMRRHK